jgi:hypothetical protein
VIYIFPGGTGSETGGERGDDLDGRKPMDVRPNVPQNDPLCPLPFVVTAAFTTALVWLAALLTQLSQH